MNPGRQEHAVWTHTHTHTHAHTCTRTCADTHARTHKHTHERTNAVSKEQLDLIAYCYCYQRLTAASLELDWGGAARSYSIGPGSGTFCHPVTAAIVEQTAVHL